MPLYDVTIMRTIFTVIEVNATNAKDAKKTVEDYGCIEAANDFPQSQPETMISKAIKAVGKYN